MVAHPPQFGLNESALRRAGMRRFRSRGSNTYMVPEMRRARPQDVEALAALEARVFSGDRLSRRAMRDHVASPTALMLVAEAGNGPVGYALAFFRAGSSTARLYSIAADPTAAPAGTGRALLAAVEEGALQRGASAVRLEVREDNTRAIALYERAGYRLQGRRAGYYQDGADALLYRRELAPSAGVGTQRHTASK
jgi:ribosomal protein S18 acetylase RimI-like enzyme